MSGGLRVGWRSQAWSPTDERASPSSGIRHPDPRATAEGIAARAGLAADRWTFCWQSAGHEPGEWMKPDFADLMPQLAEAGHRSVLVAPVQFLADHLEILYDIDVAAREQAASAGLRFARVESLNADPLFIDALAQVSHRNLVAIA